MDSFEILKNLYEQTKEREGKNAYKYVSELLKEVQESRQAYLAEHEPGIDQGQSSRSSKGKNFEKLIQYIITEPIERLRLKVVDGNKLERRSTQNLPQELRRVKRNLVIDYGESGCHLPDVDIVVYNPENWKIIAIISSKVTLRERITQTGYWKLKLLTDEDMAHIKVYFITPDEDGTLTSMDLPKKGRAIVEVDLDGTYVLTQANLEESDKVKLFEHFIKDFKQAIEESQ